MNTQHAAHLSAEIDLARRVFAEHAPDADATFLGGSHARGEATPRSDLNLLAVSALRARPMRSTHRVDGWLAELVVHSNESVLYVMQSQARDGIPRLATLLSESITLGESAMTKRLRESANQVLQGGPAPLRSNQILAHRFVITGLIDDIRQPRSVLEVVGTVGSLYVEFSSFLLRSRGEWAAEGKWIGREVERLDPALARQFEQAFARLTQEGEPEEVIRLVEDVLEPFGGFLHEGYVEPLQESRSRRQVYASA